MEVTTPEKMSIDNSELLEELIKLFEEQLKESEKGRDSYSIVVYGEYPKPICNRVEEIYMEAGWKSAICKTSSENGERPGLTGLRLYRK